MSNSSTLYTYELSDLTAWDVANVLEFATSQFTSIWLVCHQNNIPRMPTYKFSFIRHLQWEVDCFVFPYIHVLLVLNIHPTMPDLLRTLIGWFSRFQTGIITTKQLHNEFFLHCSPNGPQVSSNHRMVLNYRYDWWKDRFDCLGLELPVLNVHEVMEMTQDHFEQLPMGAMLVLGPAVTSQVDGDALFNQIVTVRTHLQHLGEAMASLLEQKHQIAAAAASTMSQLEALIAELEQVLLNSRRQFAGKP
ncbi:uncharacterized protein F5147DRAFT_650104 [Suillus discolor]|uniref:Uncharacterized protein n=1 Tax=Suillus discolor TaxID=1912936 RepID=A0A9P7FFL8_9AGAM|nr:uncharacterized protein F5147DRAFT_650104 [Suillus discolor]KAG2114326.1 hypothetical protein F5147DRAFT_650104 [Suillus discolor]